MTGRPALADTSLFVAYEQGRPLLDVPPTTVQGTVVQQQLLPKWLLPALIALIALAIIAVTLWFTVVKLPAA